MAKSRLHRRLGRWYWSFIVAIGALLWGLAQEVIGNWVMTYLSAFVAQWPNWMWWTYEHRFWIYPAFIVGVVLFVRIAVNAKEKHRDICEQIATFIEEGQQLTVRLNDPVPPIKAHNEWVDRVCKYLEGNLGKGFRVRFRDFSGLSFYSGGGTFEVSQMRTSIDGGLRRLAQFLSELGSD